MTTSTTTNLRITILVDISPASRYEPGIKSSFVEAFSQLAPAARVDFYDPVVQGRFPDPQQYDLVILSGGDNVLSGEPWIEKVIAFVEDVAGGKEKEKTKLLGICWGHQAIRIARGGTVRNRERGPVVCSSPLEAAGCLLGGWEPRRERC